jgi:23S rRNA (pseudouridine1915-N3)-methyltransferase
MRVYLISVGKRMPRWVEEGYAEYAKRLPPECRLELVEIAPGKRGKGTDARRAVADEGERMLKALPKDVRVVTLEVDGRPWSTAQLSDQLGAWLGEGRDVALLVGGPEGLAEACRRRADQSWSLSPLTFPHPLVRVVLAEQLYRAWSLLQGHPYHRA